MHVCEACTAASAQRDKLVLSRALGRLDGLALCVQSKGICQFFCVEHSTLAHSPRAEPVLALGPLRLLQWSWSAFRCYHGSARGVLPECSRGGLTEFIGSTMAIYVFLHPF